MNTLVNATCDEIVKSVCESASSDGDGPLFFDLETAPDPRIELPGDERPEAKAMAGDPFSTVDACKKFLATYRLDENSLDALVSIEADNRNRAGVFAAIEAEKKRQAEQADSDRLTLSIVPEYCRIVAFGVAAGDGLVTAALCGDGDDEGDAGEMEILRAFWTLVKLFSPPCGYNIIGFDLPVILVRSALLGVLPTRQFDLKPWSKDVIDIYAKRFPKGSGGRQPGKLKELAPLYGIEVPAGDVDGGDVAELVESDPAKLAEYVASDVEITRELYLKWKGFFF